MGGLILCSFFGVQLDAHALSTVLGKLLAHQRLQALSVYNRPDQLIESPATPHLFVLFRVGRRQTQAIWSRRHQCGLTPRSGRQVMYLVADEQFESVAVPGDQ